LSQKIEDSKDETVDKELLMKLKASQVTDPFARRVKTEKIQKAEHKLHLDKEILLMQDLFLSPKVLQMKQSYQKNMQSHGTIPILIVLFLSH